MVGKMAGDRVVIYRDTGDSYNDLILEVNGARRFLTWFGDTVDGPVEWYYENDDTEFLEVVWSSDGSS